MGGFDDNVAIIGDWVAPHSRSPRSFFSALLGDEFSSRPISEPPFENKSWGIFPLSRQFTNSSSPSKPKMNPRGGLLERMAARAGFNASRLNTESIRSADLSQTPDARSPYLTISPGLSPTTLLESPVFLSNSLVQPSPTTGKFPFAPDGSERNSLATVEPGKSKDDYFGDISKDDSLGDTVQPGNSLPSQYMEPAKVESQNGTTLHFRDLSTKDAEHSPPPNGQQDEELDQSGGGDTSVVGGGSSEDGCNWRKYGQKQVKGSEYPRSYFKCTHTNCPVEKKVERVHDGEITEIIYKGAHITPNQHSITDYPLDPTCNKTSMITWGHGLVLMVIQDGPQCNMEQLVEPRNGGATTLRWLHLYLWVLNTAFHQEMTLMSNLVKRWMAVPLCPTMKKKTIRGYM